MPFTRRVSLLFNCGYARVCIYRNSNPQGTGQYARQAINTLQRAVNFRQQFEHFGLPEDYFKVTGKDGTSPFDRDCNKILDSFKSRFPFGSNRESYLNTFSHSNWCDLPMEERKQHSLAYCARCFEQHKDRQDSFPLKPTYHHQPIITIDQDALQRQGVKKFTTNVLTELNRVYELEAGTSFADAVVTTNSSGLEKKKGHKAKKEEMVRIQKELTRTVNGHFAENAAISMLTECESKRKYHRKRMAQSFCSPHEQPPAKKNKTHSPDFSKVTWNCEKLRETIENWPVGTTINWSKVARDHGIPGKNAGQVAKEFANKHLNDTSHITTPTRKPTVRPRKRKLPGCEVSIPSNPPIRAVEAEIRSMISSGRFTLGEECAPYTIRRYTVVNGTMTPHDLDIQARKVPLTEIRRRLVQKQLKFMRLTPESTRATMTTQELHQRLNTKCEGKSDEELRQALYEQERSRSLCMWHDHATILKMGFIMVTVHVMYNSVMFYTQEEYDQLNVGSCVNIQAEVEKPEIHILAAGSSSIEDQVALIGDRVTCLQDLSTPVTTDTGIDITDTLRYFTGDHPSTQFEQGTKQGGTYKCGVCGCQEYLFNDQAHCLQHKWRSPQHLQTLATGGRFGRQGGVLKPFELRVKELKLELTARGVVLDDKTLRPDLQKTLDQILRGVSRVPALLLANPTQQLESLHLEKYEIVASEPLHDIKGHIMNLITELPTIVPPGETRTKCTNLIESCLAKEKKSGADLRRVAIQLYLLLKDLDCSSRVLFLLQSIITIGEIAYSRDNKRCPRQLLQMYNMCWLHMELCKDLLCTPVNISKTRMFGHYLHAVTAHLPTQLELSCLRSLNTENQERLFGQARGIAEKCTNHHPNNIIPQIMLRLQAKQEQHEILHSVWKGDSQVSNVAIDLPQFPATRVKTSFILKREDSWQAHLQRISPFLEAGVDVWWSHTPNGFIFHDGHTDAANPGDTFSLLHHRYHSVMDVEHRRDTSWKRIVAEKIPIPAHSIKLYNSEGSKTGRLLYNGNSVTLERDLLLESGSLLPATPDTSSVPISATGMLSPTATSNNSVTSSAHSLEVHPCVHSSPDTSSLAGDEVSGAQDIEADEVSVDDDSNTTPVNNLVADTDVVGTSFINLNLEEHEEGLKTTVGNSIKLLLGSSDDLVLFDDVRFKLKEAKQAGRSLNTTSMSKYRQMVAKMETKIRSVQSSRAAELKELEHKHFQRNGKLPEKVRGSHYHTILKERNVATAILRSM